MKTPRTILAFMIVTSLLMTNVATAQALRPLPSRFHGTLDGSIAPMVDSPDTLSGNLPCGTDSTLVGCWQMDENGGSVLLDGSSYTNDATLYGAPTWAGGIGGSYAIDLNGTSQYATVPDDASLDIEDQITIMAWIRPGQYATQDLIKKAIQGSGNPNYNGFELSLATTKTDASSQRVFFRINQQSNGDTYRINATTMYPIDGTWMHVTATYDGSTMRLYINGVEEANLTLPAGTKIALNSLPLSIGAQSTPSRYFKGRVDDARIYHRVLSPEEIDAFFNFPPVAMDDAYDTPEDTLLSVSAPGVLSNDTDADLDPLTAIKVTDPAHGILTLNPDGSFSYDPESNWSGSDSFTYKANDSQSDSNTATVTINVSAVNDPPEVIDPGPQTSAEGDVISLQIAATDVDDPALVYSALNLPDGLGIDPDNGLVSGSLTYHAAANSPYSTSITITDGTTPVTVDFTWTVNQTAFGACAGETGLVACYQMEEGSGAAIIDGSAVGNDGATTGGPAWVPGKTGTYALSFNGSSQYAIVPDNNSLDITTNNITLTAWVQPGQKVTQNILKKTLGTTTANGYELSLSSAGYVFMRLNGNVNYRVDSVTPYPYDANTWVHIAATYDGATLKVYINGVLDNSKAAITTIAANSTNLGIGAEPATTPLNYFKGPIDDARIYDRALTLDEIQVLAGKPVVADIPDQTTAEGTSFATIALDDYVSDVDNTDAEISWDFSGDTFVSVSIVDRVATITPLDADWNGSDTITFTATDPGALWMDEDAATFTVSPVNDAPVLGAIGPKVTAELVPLEFTATASDIDLPGDTLTYSLADGDDGSIPEGAGIGSTSGDFSWTPTEAQGPGSYTFDVCVSDGSLIDCGTINVTVSEVATAPVAVADTYEVLQNGTLMVAAPGVLTNDSDADIPANILKAIKVSNPSHGELLLLNEDGLFVYVPTPTWLGIDSFTYKVFDGTHYSEAVTVNIRVYQKKVYLPMVILPFTTPVLELIHVAGSETYTLNWDPINGANDYKIWESLSSTFPTDPTFISGGSTSFLLPDRNPTRYYYYLVATDGSRISLPSNTLTVDRQYELEDNDSGGTANGPLLSGITYYGQPDDMRDYYKFYLDSPATITITMSAFPADWPGQLQLFEGDTSHLVDYDVIPGDGMTVSYTSTTSGWFYILIGTGDGYSSSQWYSFTITR